jgi:ATP adenylyltransferase
MKTIWAPWRIEYILNNKKDGCVFCNATGNREGLTLFANPEVMVVMNKFPYTNGHLLVAPVRHVSTLSHLSEKEMGRIMSMVEKSMGILKKAMNPDGFNVGLNIGKVAGAGIEEHLHFHIVPRWAGDVNALTVFADVRVIPEHLKSTHDHLKPFFDSLDIMYVTGETNDE